jgi:hypothetical protein
MVYNLSLIAVVLLPKHNVSAIVVVATVGLLTTLSEASVLIFLG